MIRKWQMIATQGQELNTARALGTRPGMKSKTKLSLPSLSGGMERHSYEICVPLPPLLYVVGLGSHMVQGDHLGPPTLLKLLCFTHYDNTVALLKLSQE